MIARRMWHTIWLAIRRAWNEYHGRTWRLQGWRFGYRKLFRAYTAEDAEEIIHSDYWACHYITDPSGKTEYLR